MKSKTKNMILTGLFAALTAIGAYIVIPVGPVPITFQLLFTVMSGIFLGSKYGALSQIIYILMGLVGLPVFAGGAGGFSYIFSPSFGYVLGFVAAAFIVGKLLENDKRPGFLKIFLSCLLGTAVIYVIGYPYLYLVLTKVSGVSVTFQGLLKPAVLIFLPGDLFKVTAAAYTGRKMVPIIKR
ncbi:MAG: BioY protein [Clostridiales bacterium 38_11]|nr:MAG: BioY protein [Clostridiales bacterium 38_11]HBH13742.1 BioY family transporter [Clostridiales bacterium]